MMITLKPYPIESRSNRKEFPDISRSDHTTPKHPCVHYRSYSRTAGLLAGMNVIVRGELIDDEQHGRSLLYLGWRHDLFRRNHGPRLRQREGTVRGMGRRRRCGLDAARRPSRSRFIAGRATTLAVSRIRGQELGGGLAVTGHYPGKARTADELRSDLDKTLALLPGSHRLNLHASYAETGGRKVERDALEPEHFQRWIDWAKVQAHRHGLQPDLFRPPAGCRRLHLDPRR